VVDTGDGFARLRLQAAYSFDGDRTDCNAAQFFNTTTPGKISDELNLLGSEGPQRVNGGRKSPAL
jgi:hypothetical protein